MINKKVSLTFSIAVFVLVIVSVIIILSSKSSEIRQYKEQIRILQNSNIEKEELLKKEVAKRIHILDSMKTLEIINDSLSKEKIALELTFLKKKKDLNIKLDNIEDNELLNLMINAYEKAINDNN